MLANKLAQKKKTSNTEYIIANFSLSQTDSTLWQNLWKTDLQLSPLFVPNFFFEI